jgi:hypothetical protein
MTCSTIYYTNFEFFGIGTFWKQALQMCLSVAENHLCWKSIVQEILKIGHSKHQGT